MTSEAAGQPETKPKDAIASIAGQIAHLSTGDRAALRRNRLRSCHHAQARAHDGRRRYGGERAGQGLRVYSAATEQRATTIIEPT